MAALEDVAREAGPDAIAVTTDVADHSSVEALFARVAKEFGRLDLLFNNAGTGPHRRRSRTSRSSNGSPSLTQI